MSKPPKKRPKAPPKPPTVDPRADAQKAIAKAASKGIDAVTALGRFLDRVFGSVAEDLVALGGDPLRAYRLKRLADLQEKTDAYLKEKGVQATEPISPRIGHKIIQEASLEDDEELHSRFARLLAEALDPKGERITRQHSEVMASLTSESFRILDYCWRKRHEIGHVLIESHIRYEKAKSPELAVRSLSEVVHATGTTEDDVRHLVNVGIFRPSGSNYHVLPSTRRDMSEMRLEERFETVQIFHDVRAFEFTNFGVSFCQAVIEPIARQ